MVGWPNIGPGPTGMHGEIFIDANQESDAEEGDQRRRLQLVLRVLDVALYLARRFAAAPPDVGPVAEVVGVQFPNAVVGQARALANRPGACFVPDHPEGEFELAPVGGIAIIGESHISRSYCYKITI